MIATGTYGSQSQPSVRLWVAEEERPSTHVAHDQVPGQFQASEVRVGLAVVTTSNLTRDVELALHMADLRAVLRGGGPYDARFCSGGFDLTRLSRCFVYTSRASHPLYENWSPIGGS